MNSFNHYAYGAIGDWMVRVVAGLDLDEANPGYKHLVIHPEPGGTLTSARAELTTQYGSAVSGWKIADGRLTLDVRVPPNTRATIRLPGATLSAVKGGCERRWFCCWRHFCQAGCRSGSCNGAFRRLRLQLSVCHEVMSCLPVIPYGSFRLGRDDQWR